MGVALAATAASLINALLFRPLPTFAGEQLHRIDSGIYDGIMTAPDTRDVIEELAPLPIFSFSHWSGVEYRHGHGGGTHLVDLCEVEGDAFGVLGWRPEQGRLLAAADYLPGSEAVAVLSHAFWQQQLGGGEVLDELVNLNGVPFRVVGVLPAEFDRVKRTRVPDLWTASVHASAPWRYDNRNFNSETVVARIADPAHLPETRVRLTALSERLRAEYPETDISIGMTLKPDAAAAAEELGDLVAKSYTIAALIAGLLLVACFNVGNMLLANAYRRQREFAVRQSFGATPAHLFRLLIGESMSIALIGGALGTVAALGLTHLVDQLEFGRAVDVVFDGRALGWALMVTLVLGLGGGLVPALQMSFRPFGEQLQSGARGTVSTRVAQGLIVGQVAFCAVLLTCCFLFLQSLRASLRWDPGIGTENLVYADIHLKSVLGERRTTVVRELLERARALPGVESAGMARGRPLGGAGSTQIRTERWDPAVEADHCFANSTFSVDGWFASLDVPFVAGRDFRLDEIVYPFAYAIINESMRERFWPDRTNHEVLGAEFLPWGSGTSVRIVGVVRDFAISPWTPIRPLCAIGHYENRMALHLRTAGDPRSVLAGFAALLRDPGNEFVAGDVEFFPDAQARAFVDVDSTLRVTATLAGAALLLAACGTWFMTRQWVRLQRKELGIRLAIGATPESLLWRTVRRSIRLAAMGLVMGGALSFWLAGYLRDVLPGTNGDARPAFVAVVAVTGLVSLIASYLPARQVMGIQPREVLNEV